MLQRLANGVKLGRWILGGFLAPSRPQSAAHPLADGELVAAGDLADLLHLGVGEQNLESLTHTMSIACSAVEFQGVAERSLQICRELLAADPTAHAPQRLEVQTERFRYTFRQTARTLRHVRKHLGGRAGGWVGCWRRVRASG